MLLNVAYRYLVYLVSIAIVTILILGIPDRPYVPYEGQQHSTATAAAQQVEGAEQCRGVGVDWLTFL